MKIRRILLLAAALLTGTAASAQFYQNGVDPFGRWSSAGTAHFCILYPEGMDSLARAYVADLEKWQPLVGRSAGLDPVSLQWGRLPVILHPHSPYSNGSVTWAPRRMELFTRAEPYGSLPQSWMTQLVVHESRHVAQMQLAYRKPFRWVNYLVGEMWPGAVAALFTPPTLLEGDAVVAETALTASGRGRSADFLNYYHVAFDKGDWRDWYQWVYGSFKKAGPDYYTVGYMTVAGMRVFYGQPAFTADYFDRVSRSPFPVASLQRYIRRVSGKSFKSTFRDIQESFHAQWTEEADARGPFMPLEQVTAVPSFATDYTGGTWADGRYFAVKRGKTTEPRLVRIDPDGREHDLGAFASHTSRLFPGGDRIYWSETVPGRRWTLDGKSVVRWMDAEGKHRHDLTSEGRLYNPQPGPGGVLAVVEYPVDGGSNLLIVSGEDGRILSRTPAPECVQLTESAWIGDDLYCLGVDDRGFGIWRLRDGVWSAVLAPSVQAMEQLEGGAQLTFVSDRTGVKELYRFDPESGRTWQLTNSRYGGTGYSLRGDSLWFSSQTPEGIALFRAAVPKPVEVDIRALHRDRVAEALSAQEAALTQDITPDSKVDISVPRHYTKPLHWMKFHSWAPLWINYDAIESMSVDLSYDTASPGLTGFFQNSLGSTSGMVGYSAYPDASRPGEWRHAGHFKITHTGLYPVLEASFDLIDKGMNQYALQRRVSDGHTGYAIVRSGRDQVAWTGRLTAYIPFRFHKDGIQQGIIPQVSWSVSNNLFDSGTLTLQAGKDLIQDATHLSFLDYEPGRNVLMQNLRGSLRAYRTLPVADSRVYPRWGVGAEVGASCRPSLTQIYSPAGFAYLYGYLPGLTATQGLRLSVIGQAQFPTGAPFGENSVQVIPRGFLPADGTAIARKSARQLRLTADYAIPIYVGDLSWFSPVAYIRNFLLIPHVDWMTFGGARNGAGTPASSSLVSAGADFTVELGNFLWAPFPCSVGVSASWLGGPYFKTLAEGAESGRKPYSIGLIFSLDI